MTQWLIFIIKFIFESSHFKFVVSRLEISSDKEYVKWDKKIKNILNKFNTVIHPQTPQTVGLITL